ncbi:hypothetical protein [Lishizhenia sp.]|uniref:glycine-rich domain-containing protein n=1 Tax=Lishizhenia sp. TaxID=2497594 RepID=UPI00299E868D|nr:hypothetical protein [Lishizhenia sp.]MDX1446106.1 hypothetical protein [Lishizhenia sp.]
MTTSQNQLWQKLEAFELDDIDSSFTFSDRLARENGWSLEYSLRAIQEYKKFIFLICIGNRAMSPSDEIDQVWHLHLLYTHSYWVEMCKETIQTQIHHGPTKGIEERGTHKDLYQQTLSFYYDVFGKVPPEDIWPKSEIRFKSINFTRVNKDQNWIIPKFKLFKK